MPVNNRISAPLIDFDPERMKKLIDDLFKEILKIFNEKWHVKLENYFIDGTKIEANANRYTFVWRKSIDYDQEKVEQLVYQIDGII